MGLLDDAIREHLDLKRTRGADPGEIERLEHEALGPVRRAPVGDGLSSQASTQIEMGHPNETEVDEYGRPSNGIHTHWAPPEDPAAQFEPGDEVDAAASRAGRPKRRWFRRRSRNGVNDLDLESGVRAEPAERDFQPARPVVDHGHPDDHRYQEDPGLAEAPQQEPESAPRPEYSAEPDLHAELPATSPYQARADEFNPVEPEPPAHVEMPIDRDISGAPPARSAEPAASTPQDQPRPRAPVEPPAPASDQPPHLQFSHRAQRSQADAAPQDPGLGSATDHRADEIHQRAPRPEELQETTEFDVQASFEQGSEQDEAVEDPLEDTPDFMQETPEHDRLWFEQRPPRDFDFDG